MLKQFTKYINTLADAPNASSALTLDKEYEIHSEFSWVSENDSYVITNDNGQSTHYFKRRFSEPYNK